MTLDSFLKIDVVNVLNGLLILLIAYWVKKPSTDQEKTLTALEKIQAVQYEIATKLAEINVWKEGHEEKDTFLHDAVNARLRNLERAK